MNNDVIFEYHFDILNTLGLAVILLLIGIYVKKFIPFLSKFFIPAPVIGGLFFSLLTLLGHELNSFSFTYDDQIKSLLMTAFFTSIGFLASFKVLWNGGIAILIFLCCSILLLISQNCLGVGIAKLFDLNPLMGLAIGSVSLSGGHGSSAAFGPLLEKAGLDAGFSISIAAATFGLVAGSLIGGPVGKRLVQRFKLVSQNRDIDNNVLNEGVLDQEQKTVSQHILITACFCIIFSMAIGTVINEYLKSIQIVLPGYLIPMIVASIIRNIADLMGKKLPIHAIDIVGSISLEFFLAMALMSMQLWQLRDLAIPLITILLLQTILMILFAYFVTFRLMGKDYDAAVIACGHCGFGLGATPNAMANIQTFTHSNGNSPKAFFVIPLVGSLFIDFINAFVITIFLTVLS